MALAATTVWEARTTGSAVNGGGFSADWGGTDYSQQDSPVETVTDMWANGSEALIRSNAAGWGTKPEYRGNCCYLYNNEYLIVGFYQIVGYGTDGAGAYYEIDRICGESDVFNATCVIGGARSTLSALASVAVAGNTIWVKAGTYTLPAALTPVVNGTQQLPIIVEGYTTTRGDATAPVVTLDINGNNARVVYTTADYWRWSYLTFTGNAAYSKEGVRCHGGHNVFYRCRVTNVGGIGLSFFGTGCVAYGCEIDSWGQASTSIGVTLYANACSVIGCYLHDGTGPGITSVYPYGGGIIGTVIENCTDYGLRFSSSVGTATNTVSHVALYGNGSGGIYLDNAAGEANTPICLHNSLIISNGGYGITSNTGKGKVILLGTGFYNNTSGEIDGNTTVFEPVARVTLSGDPFLDAAGGDFRLKPDQTALLAAGWPGAFLRNGALTAWASAPDIGAVQQVVRPVWLGGL